MFSNFCQVKCGAFLVDSWWWCGR